mgnify:CR=1 FL=1
MNIYFSAAIRNGALNPQELRELIKIFKAHGRVVTEVLFDAKDFGARRKVSEREIFERDMSWIRQADCLIAEVSVPSTGVGIEIQYADCLGLPILCLFNKGLGNVLSGMVAGHPRVEVVRYTRTSEIKKAVRDFLKRIKNGDSHRALPLRGKL